MQHIAAYTKAERTAKELRYRVVFWCKTKESEGRFKDTELSAIVVIY